MSLIRALAGNVVMSVTSLICKELLDVVCDVAAHGFPVIQV